MAPVLLSDEDEYEDILNETFASMTNYTTQLIFNASDFDDVNATVNGTMATQSASYALALKFLDFFNFYYLAVIILFGMLGNVLSFLVFTRTHLKLRSSSYYLAALALADLGFLVTLLVVWLNHFGVDLFNRPGFCQALVYLSSVSSCMSVWLTVAFTFERLIAVQYPLQRPFMCTVRRAKIIIGCLTTTTLTCHIYSLFTAGVIETPAAVGQRTAVCDLLPNYYKAMRVVNLLDTVVTLVIPLILIVVMNSLIARSLVQFSRTFKSGSNKHRSPSSSNGAQVHHNQRINIQMQTLRVTPAETQQQQRNHHQHIQSGRLSPNNISGGNQTMMRGGGGGGGGGETASCRSPLNNSHHSSSNTHNNSLAEQSERSPSQPPHHNSSLASLLDNGTAELIATTTATNNTLRPFHVNGSHSATTQSLATDMIAIQNDYLERDDEIQVANATMAVDQLQGHQQSIVEPNQPIENGGVRAQSSSRSILSIRTQYTITKMLLLISTVYILLNLPSYVIRLQVFINEVMTTDTEVSSVAWLMQQFFMLLYYTNFSINFLLYSTCGATFRHCLFRMIRDKIPEAMIPERLRELCHCI